jgi:hypothetical protein
MLNKKNYYDQNNLYKSFISKYLKDKAETLVDIM